MANIANFTDKDFRNEYYTLIKLSPIGEWRSTSI